MNLLTIVIVDNVTREEKRRIVFTLVALIGAMLYIAACVGAVAAAVRYMPPPLSPFV